MCFCTCFYIWNFLLSLIKLEGGLIQMNKNNSSEIIVEKIDLDETLKKLGGILNCLENPNFSLKYNENRSIQ